MAKTGEKLPRYFERRPNRTLRIRVQIPPRYQAHMGGQRNLVHHFDPPIAIVAQAIRAEREQSIIKGMFDQIEAAKLGPRGRMLVLSQIETTLIKDGEDIPEGARFVGRQGDRMMVQRDLLVHGDPLRFLDSRFPPFSFAEGVGLWETERTNKGIVTLPKDREQEAGRMARLVRFLFPHTPVLPNGHVDLTCAFMNPVTTRDLIRYRLESLQVDIVKKTKRKMESKTIAGHLLCIRYEFELAHRYKKIPTNPAEDAALKATGKTRSENKRNAGFGLEERRHIFALAEFADPLVKWSIRLAPYLGFRNAEFYEIDTRDIVEHGPDGKPVLIISMAHRDPRTVRIKTEISERTNPLPSRWESEFLDFVRGRVAEHGHGPLWREVPLDGDGRRNDNAGNIVNAWLHNVAGTSKTFYWWRHTFKTLARPPTMATETSNAISGQSTPGVAAKYGFYEVRKMRKGVNRIDPLADPLAVDDDDEEEAA
jgi:hypothetical protein